MSQHMKLSQLRARCGAYGVSPDDMAKALASENPQAELALLLSPTQGTDACPVKGRRPGSARPYAAASRAREAARHRFPHKASDHSLARADASMQRPGSAPPLSRKPGPRRIAPIEWEAAPRPRRSGSAGAQGATSAAAQLAHPRLGKAARVFQMHVAAHQPSTPESLHAEKLTSPGMPFIENAHAVAVDSAVLAWRMSQCVRPPRRALGRAAAKTQRRSFARHSAIPGPLCCSRRCCR